MAQEKQESTGCEDQTEENSQARNMESVAVPPRSGSSPALSANKLRDRIWSELFNATEECTVFYEDVDVNTAHSVIEELDEYAEGYTHRYVA